MADSGLFLREGSTNLTSTETNPAASGASRGAISLPAGVRSEGMFVKAYFKGTHTGTSAVNTLHSTTPPTGGTYTLTLGNLTTPALAFNASTATVQAALCALPTPTAPLILNGRQYTQAFTGGTDITCSGGAFSAGDMVITFAGLLKYQPIVVVLGQASLTGQTASVVQSTTAGSQIKIQVTDTVNTFDSACYLDGSVYPYQEVALRLDPALYRPGAPRPMASINYVATVTGTITVAPVVIYLADTFGRMA